MTLLNKSILIVLVMAGLTTGCKTWHSEVKEVPPFERTLVFDRPFDVTYLKTLEALNTFPDWLLLQTNKEQGLIVLRNQQYGHVFDRDKGIARFIIRRVNRKQTSVELDPSSQEMGKGELLLEQIKQMVGRQAVGGGPTQN